jgi:hypothetical protein
MYSSYQQTVFRSGIGLRGVNCIYDDGTVISMDAGPCQEVLDNGAQLVDRNVSETEITVTTAPPMNWLPVVAGVAVLFLFGRKHVSRR